MTAPIINIPNTIAEYFDNAGMKSRRAASTSRRPDSIIESQAVMIMGNSQLGIKMSDEEAGLIVEFLGTLTGQRPAMELPILPVRTPMTPKPQP